MGILTTLILIFTFIQLVVAWVNHSHCFRLPAVPHSALRVSVLIPARNEAATLPLLLNDLMQLSVPPFEILICDDHSTDSTYTVATQFCTRSSRIRIFAGAPLPPGWLGKNYACYQLAQQAQGDYLLFLDADVRIQENCIPQLVALARQKKTGLLSVFPRQILLTSGEKATVPLMTYILLTLLPLPLVYRVPDQSALAAANGQFMLFEAAVYRRLQPHRAVRREAAEDIAISRFYKRHRQSVACITGISGIACRMYTSRHEAVQGFARNIAAFFGGSWILAFLFWLFTTLGWLPVWLSLHTIGLIGYLAVYILIRSLVSLTSRQSVGDNLFWMIPQQINLLCILLRALVDRIAGREEWKGRNILNYPSYGKKRTDRRSRYRGTGHGSPTSPQRLPSENTGKK